MSSLKLETKKWKRGKEQEKGNEDEIEKERQKNKTGKKY